MNRLLNAAYVAAGFIGGGLVSIFIARYGQACSTATGTAIVIWFILIAAAIVCYKEE